MKHILFTLAAIVICCGACKKNQDVLSEPDAQVGFFEVSEQLQSGLLNAYTNSYLLMDTQDTSLAQMGNVTVPAFGSGNIYQEPLLPYYERVSLPWISYIVVHPGSHEVTLTDTGGHRPLLTTPFTLTHGLPTTLYFADSLGYFQSLALADTVTAQDGFAMLRVIDLCPDAGNVFCTVGGTPVTAALQYGQATRFIPWINPRADTLILRFYQPGDTTDILASSLLSVSPGHAYNVVVCGYLKGQAYADPRTKKTYSFGPDLRVILTQNN